MPRRWWSNPCLRRDLVAGTVTIPPNAVPGENITVAYQVTNNGANPADGAWTDSLYLSTTQTWSASDPLLGTVQEDQDLAAGASYTGALTTPLPGVDPGSYYVIVRTNILDTIPETTLSNNLSASLTQTSISVPALTLGVASPGTLGDQQSAFYQVTVGAGQTLEINFTSSEADSLNELYVSYGSMPSRGSADYSFTALGADQEITVPATQAGVYYILAYGNDVPSSPETYSITAALVPFAVQAVVPAQVGNAGDSTLEIQGAQFDRDTSFELVGPGGQIVPATAVDVTDAATAYVTFDLTGAAQGAYGVEAVSSTGATSELGGPERKRGDRRASTDQRGGAKLRRGRKHFQLHGRLRKRRRRRFAGPAAGGFQPYEHAPGRKFPIHRGYQSLFPGDRQQRRPRGNTAAGRIGNPVVFFAKIRHCRNPLPIPVGGLHDGGHYTHRLEHCRKLVLFVLYQR